MNEKLTIVIVDDNRTNLALMDMLARKLPNCETQLFTDPQAFLQRSPASTSTSRCSIARCPG